MVRIAYFSASKSGLIALRRIVALRPNGLEIVAVFTIGPEMAKKHAVSGHADFGPLCNKHGLALRLVADYALRTPEDVEAVKECNPEMIVVNGWNRLLPADVISLPSQGSYGIHAGHPPKGRGRAFKAWSIIKAFDEFVFYLFELTPDADAGRIVAEVRVELTPKDDAGTLADKEGLASSELIAEWIPVISETGFRGIPQDAKEATSYPKRVPKDGRINFAWDGDRVDRWIRAHSDPYPGAFFDSLRGRVVVHRGQVFDRKFNPWQGLEPGRVLAVVGSGVLVSTGTWPVLIRAVEVDGRKVTGGDEIAEACGLEEGGMAELALTNPDRT